MAINPLQLPTYAAPQALDFSPLAQLGQVYQKAQQDQARQQTLASLGQGGPDAQTLLRSGDLTLAQLGVQMQNRQGEDTWRKQEAERAQQNADRNYQLQARASARADEGGPVETAAQRAQAASAYGIKPTDPAFKPFVLTGKLPEADSTGLVATVEQRKQAAIANGLDPSSPGFQSFVLTGKMPREDAQPLTAGDKEAIRTADDMIMSNKAAIDSLARAKALSKQAFAGPAAATRGYAASFLGESSDIGKGGIATENLTNEVMSNALGQLKNIFGGNPTEGERKIMMDLQGSVNKPDSVRQAIFDRAMNVAQQKLEYNRQRADQLRGNTYYKPNSTPAPVTPSPTLQVSQQQGGITQEQYASLPSGTPYTAPDGTQRIKP